MRTLFESRESDSPYIEAVWRGLAGSNLLLFVQLPAIGICSLLRNEKRKLIPVSLFRYAQTGFALAFSPAGQPVMVNVRTVEKIV